MAINPGIANGARQLESFRSRVSGTESVTFRSTAYTVRTEEVSGAKSGQNAVPHGTLGQYVANTAPRVFIFNASEFTPVTDEPLPETGEYIGYLGHSYQITHIDANTANQSAFGVFCYAMKKIYAG